jgi:predicted nuclease with TOPRIM domain
MSDLDGLFASAEADLSRLEAKVEKVLARAKELRSGEHPDEDELAQMEWELTVLRDQLDDLVAAAEAS